MILDALIENLEKCKDNVPIVMMRILGEGNYDKFSLNDAIYSGSGTLILDVSDDKNAKEMTADELLSKINRNNKCRDVLVSYNGEFENIQQISWEIIYFYR